LALSALAAAGAAWACSCLRYDNAQAQLDNAEIMFVGRAVSTYPSSNRQWEAEPGITEFTVERTLKGEHRAVRRIAHDQETSFGCGIRFQTGQTYVVLASTYQGRLSTSVCQSPQFPLAEYENALGR
jgi:hypothetical protein